jgi:hypothetical protein
MSLVCSSGTLIGTISHLSKLLLIPDICSIIEKPHFRFKVVSKLFFKNNRVSFAYCTPMIPHVPNLVSNPEIRPPLAALVIIFENTSAIMLKEVEQRGLPASYTFLFKRNYYFDH